MRYFFLLILFFSLVGCNSDGDPATYKVCQDQSENHSAAVNACIKLWTDKADEYIDSKAFRRALSACEDSLGSTRKCKAYPGFIRGGRILPCSLATTEKEMSVCGKLAQKPVNELEVPEYKELGW